MRVLASFLAATALALLAVFWLRAGGDATIGKPGAADATAASTMGPLEAATNRQGRDLSQAPARTDTAAQCSDLCGFNPACKAMSFAKDADGKGGICLLKWDVPAATENPAVTSAVKLASAPGSGR